MTSPRINTVVASAGAGKTTRIVANIAEEVSRREPEEIVATTFTVKAADELIERSRSALFKLGQAEKASRLLGARFGTVNAICAQIVAEHALELGRSPRADVVPEDSVARLFAVAANAAIEGNAAVLNDLAEAFGYFEPKRDGAGSDWRATVRRLIELARANGIDGAALERSADLSIASFLPLLPVTNLSAISLDRMLADAVFKAVAAIPEQVSSSAQKSIALIRQTAKALERKERLSWPDWARLSKVSCAKKDGQDLVNALADLCKVASRHPEHPRLRDDCESFIRTVFACAAEALTAYQNFKAERGLLDFTDQESLALEVLKSPAMHGRLAERISRVFVDEFQDSSPLQIAIFTAMAELVNQSTWVGDPKQAIYGFRNADCALTQAAFDGVASMTAEPQEALLTSYRSRAGIIDLVNHAFEPAFLAMGLRPEDHSFSGTARSEEGFDRAPLSVWWLNGKSAELRHQALAAAIKATIVDGAARAVGNKDGTLRTLRAGDIAVLCRSKADMASVARALSDVGVKVAVERDGLLRTPHIEFVMAAFRWVADPFDRLALAELARFFGDDPQSDVWLHAASAEDQIGALKAAVPISLALDDLRDRLLALTPANLLDAILVLPEITQHIEAWGDGATYVDDLEALRGYARAYEASCASSGTPATPSGLILALATDEPARPRSRQADAVKISTYHAAKGLEWPMVILTGLEKEPRPRLFEPVAEAEGELDWRDPLAGRWIRFWPWPYGSQSKDVLLDVAALDAPLGQVAADRARDEETRLLYVGLTRARDYVVFAPAAKGDLNWLNVLDTKSASHVSLPSIPDTPISIAGKQFTADIKSWDATETYSPRVPPLTYTRLELPKHVRAPLRRRPSSETDGIAYEVIERIQLGPRLPLTGAVDMTILGEAVHAIFSADRAGAGAEVRLQRASAILERWQVHQIAAVDVLDACDRLQAHLVTIWPSGRVRREVPLSARLGAQLVVGRIDLLLDDGEKFAVIDHKTFPGAQEHWGTRATGYGPQLGLYAAALGTATGKPCEHLYIHMPVVGALLRVAPKMMAIV